MAQHTVISSGVFYKGVTTDLKSPIQGSRLIYTPGSTVVADSVDLDPRSDCGHGINFCRTLAEALRYAKSGTVVAVMVPDDVVIVDTGGKLRSERVTVGDQVNLTSANLRYADLRYADLTSANLRYATGNAYTALPNGWEVNDSGLIIKT